MECCTVEATDLLELAAEVRALRLQVREALRRNAYRERRLTELLAALGLGIEPSRPPPAPGTLAAAKAEAVRRALAASQGCRVSAARVLQVNVKTLYSLMKALGVPTWYGRNLKSLGAP